jgi:hypothetical protein
MEYSQSGTSFFRILVVEGKSCSSAGHGLEEELEDLVKVWRHILQDHAGDSVLARSFVVRGTPERFLHDGRGDAAQDHRNYVLMVGGTRRFYGNVAPCGSAGSGDRD